MKNDRDSVTLLNRIMCVVLFIALMFVFWLVAATARAATTIPSPFDDMRDVVVDFERDCIGGMCTIPREDLLAIARFNNALALRLEREIQNKTKTCAKLTREN